MCEPSKSSELSRRRTSAVLSIADVRHASPVVAGRRPLTIWVKRHSPTHYCLEPGTFGGTLEALIERVVPDDQLQRLRIFKATIRTVQDIVNNLLNGFHLVQIEAGSQLSPEVLTLIDQMIHEASGKLKALGELETVTEKEMAVGLGIEYPGSS